VWQLKINGQITNLTFGSLLSNNIIINYMLPQCWYKFVGLFETHVIKTNKCTYVKFVLSHIINY